MRNWILILILAGLAQGQTHPWDGILDPSRATDWANQVGIPGGIPNVTTVCSAAGYTFPIQPSNDTTGAQDRTTINNAISACGALATQQTPLAVTLAAGVFYINSTINFGNPAKNYTVLRGAGPDKTTIVGLNYTSTNCGQWGYICILGSSGWSGSFAGARLWQGGYAQGSTVLTLDATTGLSTTLGASGNIIILDQLDDAVGICPPAIDGTGAGPTCAPGGTPVNGLSEVGTTVTVNTSLPHHLSQGDCVGVGGAWQAWTVTNAVWNTGGSVTFTIGPNSLFVGTPTPALFWQNTITVGGITPSGFNGTFSIGSVNSSASVTTTASAVGTNPGPYTSGGYVRSTPAPGYNSDTNLSISCQPPGAPGARTSHFQVTQVLSPTSFQYTAANTGLAPGGRGQVGKDTGGVLWSAVSGPFINEAGPSSIRTCSGPTTASVSCAVGEYSRRDVNEYKRVTNICTAGLTWQIGGGACAANTIQIYPPIELPMWRAAQNPGIWWTGNYALQDGIENLTLDMAPGLYSSSVGGILIQNAYQSWIRNVRTLQGNRNHIWTLMSLQLVIRDNYMFGVKGSANTSYGIEDYGGDGLNENNICQHVITCEITGGDWGTVWGYDYGVDGPWGAGTGQGLNLMNISMLNHDFSGLELHEGGNTTYNFIDNIHGTAYGVTGFRSRYRAQDTPRKFDGQTGIVAHWSAAFNRGHNIVDSVLGTFTNGLTYYEKTGAYGGPTIYNAGWQAETYQVPWDFLAKATMLRWGNYDICTASGTSSTTTLGIPCAQRAGSNGIRFCGNSSNTGWATTCLDAGGNPVSEIPTASFPPGINGNPIPTKGDTTIGQAPFPASFYLPGQPDFWQTAWGTPGWPAIGSDVTASGPLNATCQDPAVGNYQTSTKCDGVANHSYQIPAQLCFNNVGIDSAGFGPATSGTQQVYSITAMSWTGGSTTATVGAHSIPVGALMRVSGVSPAAYNSIWQVTSATGTTVTWTQPAPCSLATCTPTVLGVASWPNQQQSYSITGAPSWSTSGAGPGTGFVTVPIGLHVLNVGDVFTIAGANPSDYNGTWMVYSVTQTSITYNQTTPQPAAWQSGGTVTWPNIRNFNAATCYPVAYGGEVGPQPSPAPSIINGHGTITGQGKIS